MAGLEVIFQNLVVYEATLVKAVISQRGLCRVLKHVDLGHVSMGLPTVIFDNMFEDLFMIMMIIVITIIII